MVRSLSCDGQAAIALAALSANPAEQFPGFQAGIPTQASHAAPVGAAHARRCIEAGGVAGSQTPNAAILADFRLSVVAGVALYVALSS